MNPSSHLKVLFIEDDEDDFILTRDMLKGIHNRTFDLDWIRTYEAGLQAALENRHDICLLDYRLGPHTGLDLLKAAIAGGCQLPIILLTGMGQAEVDVAAMRAGASDYLVKSRLEQNDLERTIRYAIERKHATALAAFEQARLAAFGADVGLALTLPDPLNDILQRCAATMVQYQNATLAQIWIYDVEQRVLVPHAGAGALFKPNASGLDLPVLSLNIEELRSGKPVLIKKVIGDARLSDQRWAERKELASFAAHPLVLENQLVGLMSLYSTTPLTEVILQEMASVAHGIALCIGHKQSELALKLCKRRYRAIVENLREVVFQMNEFGHWTSLNPAWTVATGFSVKEAIGNFFLDYIHPDDRAQNRAAFLELVERKTDFCRHESRFITKDGQTRWMEIYLQLTVSANGTVLGTSGNFYDITEHKLMESQTPPTAPEASPTGA